MSFDSWKSQLIGEKKKTEDIQHFEEWNQSNRSVETDAQLKFQWSLQKMDDFFAAELHFGQFHLEF